MVTSLTNTTDWTDNGSATWVSHNDSQWVQLTANSGSQAGSVFNNTKIQPEVPWFARFRYEVGDMMSNPADGMSFVLPEELSVLAGQLQLHPLSVFSSTSITPIQ